MRPQLSEFSYGYALTEELATGAFGTLIGAPIFPSLRQEGQIGGGYDLKLPVEGSPLFLQFKLSDCMKSRHSKHWSQFNAPYYRMHIRPKRHSDQQHLLCQLEKSHQAVYYVAPLFHTSEELNEYYAENLVHAHSEWFLPSSIGELPDDDEHYLAFNSRHPIAYFCSSEPRLIKGRISTRNFIERQRQVAASRKERVDKLFFTRIADQLLEISRRSDLWTAELDEPNFKETRRRTTAQEAHFAAFLSRSIFNAELLVTAESTVEVELFKE